MVQKEIFFTWYFIYCIFNYMYMLINIKASNAVTAILDSVHENTTHHYETRLFIYIENFTTKTVSFQIKNTLIFFHISAQNIDCGYSLEPPRRGDSNEYPQSMFWAEISKISIPLQTPVLLYKSGVYGGQNYIGMFSWCKAALPAGTKHIAYGCLWYTFSGADKKIN